MITCFFENKKKAYLRHVTVDAILIQDNKILLVKRAPHRKGEDRQNVNTIGY